MLTRMSASERPHLSDISFANPAPRSSCGYHMISLGSEGAVEARFLRLASSTDLNIPAALACVELDNPDVRRACRKAKRQGVQGWSLMRFLTCKTKARCRPQTFGVEPESRKRGRI